MKKNSNISDIISKITTSIKNNDILKLRSLSKIERDNYILQILNFLELDIKKSGKDYYPIWERGWEENLNSFLENHTKESLVPKYIRKKLPIRIHGDLYMPINDGFELGLLNLIKENLFSRYLKEKKNIIEFGCGTGHHLLHCAEKLGTDVKYFGLDWSKNSNKLVNEIASVYNLPIHGIKFDMFKPNYNELDNFNIEDLGIFTIGAFEQLGLEWHEIKKYIFSLKPKVVIHLEPTIELYNNTNLIDKLAISYHKKKLWLDGYINSLKIDEANKKIEILEQCRTFGSFYHEAYTLTVWRPKL